MFDKNSDYVVLTMEQVSQSIPSKPLSYRMLQLRQASFFALLLVVKLAD